MSEKKLRSHAEISQDYSKLALQFGDLSYKNKAMDETISKLMDSMASNKHALDELKKKMDLVSQEKFEPGTEPKPPEASA